MLQRFEEFSTAIFKIQRSIQKIEADEMEKFHLKGSFAQYLLAMARHPEGIPAAELCRICDKDKAAVSRALAEMEEKGLINRPIQTGYRVPFTLTEQGQKVAQFVATRAISAVEVAGRGLGEEERGICYRSLGLIAENLNHICKDGLK